MVLFTGDLTQSGGKSEFDEFERLLRRFWDRFKEWGFTPEFFVVPGNHDLVRPANTSDPALITMLHTWSLPAVQTPFWEDAASPQRALVTGAFQHFSDWWGTTAIPKPAEWQRGLLPGDCAATVKAGEYKLGLVGLNSAFLQLGKEDFQGKLHLDVRQLHAACCGNGADWTRQHDICLLLTHHPVCWLQDEVQKHFAAEIHAPPERFALHLFGHMHEGNLSILSHGGGNERRCYQGASLFGLESWGEKGQKLRRELFGERHPDVALSLHNMAGHHRALGDMHRAYAYAQKACEIRKHIFGPQHPATRRPETLLAGIRRPGFRTGAVGKSAGKRKKGKGGR